MDTFVGVHDSDWLHGGKAIAAWYTLKGEMEVPADGNECVNVDWILSRALSYRRLRVEVLKGENQVFLILGKKAFEWPLGMQVTVWMHNYIKSQELGREDGWEE